MKNANLKLTKIVTKDGGRIEINSNGNELLGYILPDGCFLPVPRSAEIYPAELQSIIAVSENFNMFYDNLK